MSKEGEKGIIKQLKRIADTLENVDHNLSLCEICGCMTYSVPFKGNLNCGKCGEIKVKGNTLSDEKIKKLEEDFLQEV